MVTNIEHCDFTPTEIREAAMLAQILYEERHPRPIEISDDEFKRLRNGVVGFRG